MKILVTGSSGLIGSEAVTFFDEQGHEVHGVDSNMRAVFFGPQGDTTWNRDRLLSKTKNFKHSDQTSATARVCLNFSSLLTSAGISKVRSAV